MRPWPSGDERELVRIVETFVKHGGRLGAGTMLLPILVVRGTPGGGHEQITDAFDSVATGERIPIGTVKLPDQRGEWASDLLSLMTAELGRKVEARRPLTFPRFYTGRLAAFARNRFGWDTRDRDVAQALHALRAAPNDWYRIAGDATDILGAVPALGPVVKVAKASVGALSLIRRPLPGRTTTRGWSVEELYELNRDVHLVQGGGLRPGDAQARKEQVELRLTSAFLHDLAARYSGVMHRRDPVAGGLMIFTGGRRQVDANLLRLLAKARSEADAHGADTPDRMMIVLEWVGDPGDLGGAAPYDTLALREWRQSVRAGVPDTRIKVLVLEDIPTDSVGRYAPQAPATRSEPWAATLAHRLAGGHWQTTRELLGRFTTPEVARDWVRVEYTDPVRIEERLGVLLPGVAGKELEYFTAAALLPALGGADVPEAYIAWSRAAGGSGAASAMVGPGRSDERQRWPDRQRRAEEERRIQERRDAAELHRRLLASPWLEGGELHPLSRRLLIARALVAGPGPDRSGPVRRRWDRAHRALAMAGHGRDPASGSVLYHLLALGDLQTVAAVLDAACTLGPRHWLALVTAVTAAPCPLRLGRPEHSAVDLLDTALDAADEARAFGGAGLKLPDQVAESARPALPDLLLLIAALWVRSDPVEDPDGALEAHIVRAYLALGDHWRALPDRGERWETALIAAAAARRKGL